MGMEVAKSPADLISKVPVVFINHFDSNAVGDVMESEEGIFKGD
jgi:3-hydroxyisobutyrate dehydrogenase-like beta-hydroxyacid dehydrogenase